MTAKLQTIDAYRPEATDVVRAACLHLATILGDYLNEVVIVGGLVPSLLVDQARLPIGVDAHAGTADLDVGLALTVLDDGRYSAIADRLREQGLEPHPDENGRMKFRWRWVGAGSVHVTVDFLIPPADETREAGDNHTLEPGFVALVAPALALAFRDFDTIELKGTTLDGAQATRSVKVCGPAAFVAMKAHAFGSRGARKDAYDVYYLLRAYEPGVEEIARRFRTLLDDVAARKALALLRQDFIEPDGLGPTRAGLFLKSSTPALRLDVATYVRDLLRLVGV